MVLSWYEGGVCSLGEKREFRELIAPLVTLVTLRAIVKRWRTREEPEGGRALPTTAGSGKKPLQAVGFICPCPGASCQRLSFELWRPTPPRGLRA